MCMCMFFFKFSSVVQCLVGYCYSLWIIFEKSHKGGGLPTEPFVIQTRLTFKEAVNS